MHSQLKYLLTQFGFIEDEAEIEIEHLKGAMTNSVYSIKIFYSPNSSRVFVLNEPKSMKLLLRVYGEGTDQMFNRVKEMQWQSMLSRNGHAPLILCCFSNGRIEEYVSSRTLTAADLRSPELIQKIATNMAKVHSVFPEQHLRPTEMVSRLNSWLQELQSSACSLDLYSFEELQAEAEFVSRLLDKMELPVVFVHNDLQYGNIVQLDSGEIMFLDYEYSGLGIGLYDIANHFCEWAADYSAEAPHNLDFSQLPTIEQQRLFLESYLKELQYSGKIYQDCLNDVDRCLSCIQQLSLYSHISWGIWGYLQSNRSKIQFDYRQYAQQRLEQYKKEKAKISNLFDFQSI